MANNILLPIAGRGQRFVEDGYETPKPLIKTNGKYLIERSLESLDLTQSNLIFVVRKEHIDSHGIDEILNLKYGNDIKIIPIDYVTEGTLCTCLLAEEFINNKDSLTIFTPDCYFEPKFYYPKETTSSGRFLWNRDKQAFDALVATFYSAAPAHSYVRLNTNNVVQEAREKEVISNHAIGGLYYFKSGFDFVSYAKIMIEKNIRVNNEFYIAPIFNLMISSQFKVTIDKNTRHDILGTPEDIEKHEL